MQSKNDLLGTYRAEIKYFRAYQCSCIAANNGVYDPSDNCYFGWRYETPGSDYTLIGKNYRQFSGHFSPGLLTEAQCTFFVFKDDPLYPYIGIGDVLVSKDQKVTKICMLDIAESTDIPKKNIIPDFDVDTSGNALVIVYSKDADNQDIIYVRDTDYTFSTIDGNAVITWIGESPEKYFSVKYTSQVNFMVWDILPSIEEKSTGDAFKTVICKLRKFGKPSDGNLIDNLGFTSQLPENINI